MNPRKTGRSRILVGLQIAIMTGVSLLGCGGGGGGGGGSSPVDTTPPSVSSTSPSSNATTIALNSSISVSFGESIDPASISGSTIILSNSGTNIACTYACAGSTVTFYPVSLFVANKTYTVTITSGNSGPKDLAGNSMPSNYSWSFSTGATIDTSRPSAVPNSPSAGQTGVPVNDRVSIQFSEPMDASTVTTSTLPISAGGSPVNGSLTYDTTSRVALFTPLHPLGHGTLYTVSVTTGALDLAGNTAFANSWTFTTDPVLSNVVALSAGVEMTAVLKNDGTVWAWGVGAVGDGSTYTSLLPCNKPIQVKGPSGVGYLSGIIAVSAGDQHVLALKNDGTVWAWGENGQGQLGDNTTTTPRLTPVQVTGLGGVGFLTGVIQISAGAHSMALKNDGSVWSWGKNPEGQLGNGTAAGANPTPNHVVGPGGVGFLSSITAISAGLWEHSVALKSDGSVWTWGSNWYGALGTGTAIPASYTPVQVVGEGGVGFLSGVSSVSAGNKYSLAIKTDGTVRSWGKNDLGQLGIGTNIDNNTPQVVSGLANINAISAGDSHAVALKSDNTVRAWGYNNLGQLGDASTIDKYTDVQVLGSGGVGFLAGVLDVSGGSGHSVALMSDGTVWAWGGHYYGAKTSSLTPLQVGGP